MTTNKTFEECFDRIDAVIRKRQQKWQLKAIAWMDYDDISQIIRIHINKKWHLWDQTRPLEPWINRIVCHQIKNIIRNTYSSIAKPCLDCSFYQTRSDNSPDNKFCAFTPSKIQCNECPRYARWEKTRKAAFDIRLPLSLESQTGFYNTVQVEKVEDFQTAETRLHALMKINLSDKEFFIYKMFFIDNMTDQEVAKILKFKTNEPGRKAGYKQINNLKQKLFLKARELMNENDLFE